MNAFKATDTSKRKSGDTAGRILDGALNLFRTKGFEATTMRDVAQAAGVATGAAYYHFDSKHAIVMAFYRRACDEMQPLIAMALQPPEPFEARLRKLIEIKLDYFSADRNILRALLRHGADPSCPLSPFSPETREIREVDIAWFRRVLTDSGIRVPRDLQLHLPGLLWFLQMGIILFWLVDRSAGQSETRRLLQLAPRVVVPLLRWSAVPLLRPLRRPVVELIALVKGVTTNQAVRGS